MRDETIDICHIPLLNRATKIEHTRSSAVVFWNRGLSGPGRNSRKSGGRYLPFRVTMALRIRLKLSRSMPRQEAMW